MSHQRNYTRLDKLCIHFDQALKTITGHSLKTNRRYPAETILETELAEKERKVAAAIMRVNHAGEVCAQALYQGQSWFSKNPEIKIKLHQAMIEEGDHLAWCSKRLSELQSHTSYLNPLWYLGSLAIGVTASLVGDQWNLGFLAETENQVVNHLEKQLRLLPTSDHKSYKILQQMQYDEAAHREEALKAGAKELPEFIKKLMRFSSGVMVKTSYYI